MQQSKFTVGSFAPIVSSSSKVLIIGTMPGNESLVQQKYYAHPRNLFWEFMFLICAAPFSKHYPTRQQLILSNQLALWDTLGLCERKGSLDSNIKNETPNDISGLLQQYPNIKAILCNGKAAENYLKRYHVLDNIHTIGLPSTSPANASIPREKKYTAWKSTLINLLHGN